MSQALLPLDRWLSAASGGELELFPDRGWHPPESWGRWGEGATHRILLPNRGLSGSNLFLDLRIMQLADKAGRIPRIEVRVNQTLVATISVARPMQPQEHRIVIPPASDADALHGDRADARGRFYSCIDDDGWRRQVAWGRPDRATSAGGDQLEQFQERCGGANLRNR